jgi:hypothetical protein
LKLKRRRFTAAEIATVESRIRVSTHPRQRDFIFDPARWLSLLCGRGAGKTFAVLCRMVLAMLAGDRKTGKGANCLYIAKNREQARGIVWNDLKEIIHRLGFEALAKFDEVRSEMSLCNGSWIKLAGFDERDEIEKHRGKTWHAVAIDEAGSARTDLLARLVDDVIGWRLVGWLVLLGTPGYLLDGTFYEVSRPDSPLHRPYAQRDQDWPEGWLWSSHAWSQKDGADAGIGAIAELWRIQLEDKAKKGYSDSNPKWLREGMGQWAKDDSTSVYVYRAYDDNGAEFNQWTPTIAATDSTRWARLPPGWDPKTWGYALVMDIGWKDAFALEAFAYSYADPSRTCWQIGEIYLTKQPTKAVATMLIGEGLDVGKPGGIIGELGWPDFMVADADGQGDRFVEDMKLDYGILIKAVDKHPKYKDPAIEIVNADMFEGRFKIMRDSHLAKELVGLQWVIDPENGKRRENPKQPNHATDALLYFRVSVSALLPAFATAQPKATESATASPHVSRRAPSPKDQEDGWSSDVEGWTAADDMEGATEGAW